MVPPFFIDGLVRLVRIFVVTLEDVGPLDAHLALVVPRPVLHVGYVN